LKERLQALADWLRPLQATLWRRRKVLLPLALLVVVLEAMYFLWMFLPLLVSVLLIYTVLSTLWIHQSFDKVTLIALIENLWLAIVAAGAVVFLLQSPLALHGLVAVFGLLTFLTFRAQADFRSHGIWEVNDIPRLQLVGMLGFFVAAAIGMKIAEFYLAGPWAVLLTVGVASSLFAWFNFRRIQLPRERGMVLVAVFLLVLEEVAWLLFNWDAGVFFKAFILTSFYFLFFELLTQYYRGSLTIRVASQYGLGAVIILLVLFVANSIVPLI
jgi:hypothetical protein